MRNKGKIKMFCNKCKELSAKDESFICDKYKSKVYKQNIGQDKIFPCAECFTDKKSLNYVKKVKKINDSTVCTTFFKKDNA